MKAALGEVPTWAKLLQPGSWQRSTRLLVPAAVQVVQVRLIWLLLAAAAIRLDGAVGGGGAWVVALAALEYALRPPGPLARAGWEEVVEGKRAGFGGGGIVEDTNWAKLLQPGSLQRATR